MYNAMGSQCVMILWRYSNAITHITTACNIGILLLPAACLVTQLRKRMRQLSAWSGRLKKNDDGLFSAEPKFEPKLKMDNRN